MTSLWPTPDAYHAVMNEAAFQSGFFLAWTRVETVNASDLMASQFAFKPCARTPSLAFQNASRAKISPNDMSGEATSKIATL